MKCPNCGNEISDNQKYCSNCGALINGESIEINNTKQTTQNSTSPLMNIISFIIVIVLLFCAWKYFVQPTYFPTDLQENGYTAEFYAKNYLGDFCKENELEVKAIEENNGIYVVECKTTNSTLKQLYGSTFYYGYMPMADGKTYKQHADKTISAVYSMLEK